MYDDQHDCQKAGMSYKLGNLTDPNAAPHISILQNTVAYPPQNFPPTTGLAVRTCQAGSTEHIISVHYANVASSAFRAFCTSYTESQHLIQALTPVSP